MSRRCSSCGEWMREWLSSSTRSSVEPERTLHITNTGAREQPVARLAGAPLRRRAREPALRSS